MPPIYLTLSCVPQQTRCLVHFAKQETPPTWQTSFLFVSVFETGSYYVAQATRDPPASASQGYDHEHVPQHLTKTVSEGRFDDATQHLKRKMFEFLRVNTSIEGKVPFYRSLCVL